MASATIHIFAMIIFYKRISLVISLTCALVWLAPTQTNAQQGWTLVWSDEFDRPNGSSPDSGKWGYNTGAGGWGNNELQYYTSRTNNARIEDGRLIIEAHKESYQGSSYTSARLLTKGKWSWSYVRVEGRIKIPRGQGIWPAFWMLGANIDSAGWPACGEIDIMENIGKEPGIVHGTIHGPGYSGGNSIGGPYSLASGAFADDFHVYAMEWETNRIRWFVDGKPYFTATPLSLPSGQEWVFTKPEFLILNLAVGGNWPGYPDATTQFPQRMVVDYVRVYSRAQETACGGNALTNPGFELAGLANWMTYGAGGNTQLAPSASLPVHSGSNSFKVYGQFNGADNYSGVLQNIPSFPGAVYSAHAWAISPANDRIAGNNQAWVEVSFRDTAGTILSLYRSTPFIPSSPAGIWIQMPVTNRFDPTTFAPIGNETALVAPAGTSLLRYQLVFRQQSNASGAVLFDDLSLEVPGPDEIPIGLSAAKNGSGLSLSFPTSLGSSYQVRYKNDLGDQTWQVLSNISGTGTPVSLIDPLGTYCRFYRVSRLCQ